MQRKFLSLFLVLCFATQPLVAMRQHNELTYKDKPIRRFEPVSLILLAASIAYTVSIVIYSIKNNTQAPWLDPLSGAAIALKDVDGNCFILTRSLPGTMVPLGIADKGAKALIGSFLRRGMREARLTDCPKTDYQIVAAHKVFPSLVLATSNPVLTDRELEPVITKLGDQKYKIIPKETRKPLHPFYLHSRDFTNMTYIANEGKPAWGCIFVIPFPSLEQIQDITMNGNWHNGGQKLIADLVATGTTHVENQAMENCINDSHIPVRGILFHEDGSGVAVLFRLVGNNKWEFEARLFQALSRHGYDLEPKDTSCYYPE